MAACLFLVNKVIVTKT